MEWLLLAVSAFAADAPDTSGTAGAAASPGHAVDWQLACERGIGVAAGVYYSGATWQSAGGASWTPTASPLGTLRCDGSIGHFGLMFGVDTAPLFHQVDAGSQLRAQWIAGMAGLSWHDDAWRLAAYARTGLTTVGVGAGVTWLPIVAGKGLEKTRFGPEFRANGYGLGPRTFRAGDPAVELELSFVAQSTWSAP